MTIEIVYRLDPEAEPLRPSDAGAARRALEKGNERFASLASRGKTAHVADVADRDLGIVKALGYNPFAMSPAN